MKLLHEKPAIYQRLVDKFGVSWDRGIIITYGDNVYCKNNIGPDLIAHESVHVEQQKKFGVEAWWDKYIAEEKFRLEQEVEAYRAQYKFVCQFAGRVVRREAQRNIARELSSSTYGRIITYHEALEIIK